MSVDYVTLTMVPWNLARNLYQGWAHLVKIEGPQNGGFGSNEGERVPSKTDIPKSTQYLGDGFWKPKSLL